MKTGDYGMNNNLINEIQKETYETALDYLPKLIKTAALVAKEFQGEEQEDTKDLFNQVVEGINWILDVYNHSDSILYRGGEQGTKEELEEKIQRLSHAISKQNKQEMGNALTEDMIPFLEKYLEEIRMKIK